MPCYLLADHDSRCANIKAGGKPSVHPIFMRLLLLVAWAGGLGKMPGYYYTAELDCAEDQSIRCVRTALLYAALLGMAPHPGAALCTSLHRRHLFTRCCHPASRNQSTLLLLTNVVLQAGPHGPQGAGSARGGGQVRVTAAHQHIATH